jgi:DNA-binding NarL/FixJ family response regulator
MGEAQRQLTLASLVVTRVRSQRPRALPPGREAHDVHAHRAEAPADLQHGHALPATATTAQLVAAMRRTAQRLLREADEIERVTGLTCSEAVRPDTARPARTDNGLTARQLEILDYVARGWTTERIAAELYLSVATVRNHIARTLRALDAHSRVEGIAKARRLGLL